MGDRLRAAIPPRYVIKPTRSTQSCIPSGSLNRVPALIGWGKSENVISTEWQAEKNAECDLIWHVSRVAVRLVGNCNNTLYLFLQTHSGASTGEVDRTRVQFSSGERIGPWGISPLITECVSITYRRATPTNGSATNA